MIHDDAVKIGFSRDSILCCRLFGQGVVFFLFSLFCKNKERRKSLCEWS